MILNKSYIKNLIVLIFICFYSLELKAERNVNNYKSHIFAKNLDNKNESIQINESFILEKEIEPENYILGPGDEIGISITASSDIISFLNPYITIITPSTCMFNAQWCCFPPMSFGTFPF